MTPSRSLPVFVGVLLLLVGTSCSSDVEPAAPASSAPASSNHRDAAAISPSAADTASSAGTVVASAESTTGSALESLAAVRGTAVVRVVYNSTDAGGSARLIWSQDPPKLRVEDRSGLTISDGTNAVTCPGPDRSPCTQIPAEGAERAATSGLGLIGLGVGLLDSLGSLPDGFVTESGNEQIAGREAQCRTLDPMALGALASDAAAAEADPVEFCTDTRSGWLLSATGAGLTLVATEVGEPTPGDFVLP